MADDASKFVLLASPNWYCSTVADCSLNSVYAFGARNCVYLLDVSSVSPVFEGQLDGHVERVSSVCFSKHKLHASFLASGSDDKTVKIWDVGSKLALMEHKAHNAKVTCLAWSPVVTDLIISGDEKGSIIAWRYTEENLFEACPVQDHIFSVALSYISQGEIAVGYKSGLIAVLNVDTSRRSFSLVHKLQGHSSEIHSLTWCPAPKEDIDFGPIQDKVSAAEGHLIVSGSRDQTVRLWNAAQGKVLSIKQLPKRSSRKDKHDSYGPRDRLWVSVCWPAASPGHVISSSHGGEILLWDLSKNEGRAQCQTFGVGHSRIVFNISCDISGTRVLTASMDRQIVIWDPQQLRSLQTLPTLGGFAYSLGISPLDPGTVGIGVGDNMLRVWQTTSSAGPYEALTVWQGIKSKVMVVKWHPSKEGLLAFGADDGQVGVYNIISKKLDSSSTYHKKTVYSLSWGPPCPTEGDGDTLNLYSCAGNGTVLEHKTGHFMDDAVDVNALILKTNNLKHKPFGRTDVSWNPDGSVMALGNEDGSIELYVPPDLQQVGMIITHKKSITTLMWHHGHGELTAVVNGKGSVSCKYWLASGSNESTIHVHDLSNMLDDLSSPTAHAAPITECFRKLSGHSGRITDLNWSPHQSELLLSSSYDGTAQVWDAVKGEALYNFRGHSSRVMCVVWSYLDPDLVYSGGEDGTVRPWRPSLQQHRQPPVSDKKTSHSASKSSKSKKNKQKGKGKTPSDNKETWRHQPTSNLEHTSTLEKQARADSFSDHSQEPQIISPTSTSEPKPRVKEKEEKPSVSSESEAVGKEPVMKTEEAQNSNGRTESKEGVVAENESLDIYNTCCLVEEKRPDVVLKQEKVIPLRSKVSLETTSSSKKKRKVKSMFPLSAVADSKSKTVTREECIELAKINYGQEQGTPSCGNSPSHEVAGSQELVNLGLFADRRSAYRMFTTEGEHHKDGGNLDYQLQLEIWKGNLSGALQMANNNNQLIDWLVALSPLGGREVWMATTRAFADQLESQGQYQRAVLYYLACHDTYKAIDVFKKQHMYREAIALAKVRLSPSDPVLFDLYSTWARKLETDNAFEQAAKCYLAVHSSSDAVRVLCRRGDQPSLRTALQVAIICGELDLVSSLAPRLIHSYLLSSDWRGCHDVLKDCPEVEAHMLNVCVHELLLATLADEKTIHLDNALEDGTRTHISSILSSCTSISGPWGKYTDIPCSTFSWIANDHPKKWFVVCVLEAWHLSGALKSGSFAVLCESIKTYYETTSTGADTIPEMLAKISLEITLGLLKAITGNLYLACQYWLQALSYCNKNCLFGLQRQLCCMLLPQGSESLNYLQHLSQDLDINSSDEPQKVEDVQELFRHFLAYYYKAILIEIWYRCPDVLSIFTCNDNITVENGECTSNAENGSNASNEAPLDSSKTLLQKCALNMFENSSVISEYNRTNKDESVTERGVYGTISDVVGSGAYELKELLSSTKRNRAQKQDMMTTLENLKTFLLSEQHMKINCLREILTDIRKAILLKRSRQLMEAISTDSKVSQKKKNIKTSSDHLTHSSQPQGFLPSRGEGDLTSETTCRGSSVDPGEFTQTTSNEEFGFGDTVYSESQPEETEKEPRGDGLSGSVRDEEAHRDEEMSTARKGLGAISASEATAGKLSTSDGKLPVDLRYITNETTLAFLIEEEKRALNELEELEFKDLSFPSPLESALIMGHLCACSDGLPIYGVDLRELGIRVVQWAQRFAQTCTDLKAIRRIDRMHNSNSKIM